MNSREAACKHFMQYEMRLGKTFYDIFNAGFDAAIASQAQQEPVKLPPEWEKNVTTMWRCVRHNDCSIPSDDLDLMRSMLLSFIPPAPEGE